MSTIWPNIRSTLNHGKPAWVVDARLAGKGERRFFSKKQEAEGWAQTQRVRRQNEGVSAFDDRELKKFGKTVRDAIEFYVAHLKLQEKSITVSAAMDELVEMRRSSGRTDLYCRQLGQRIGKFCKQYGMHTVSAISTREVDSWLSGLKASPGTRNTHRRDIRTLFSFCVKRGYVERNPVSGTEIARTNDAPPGILTVLQASALLAVSDADLLPYVAIGLFAGLRASEIEKLDWAEVNLETGYIEVKASKSKTAARRLVKISNNLRAFLQPTAKTAGPVVPIGLRKKFDSTKYRAGITNWPSNAMRHSFASYHLAQHKDAAALALEMGNSPQMVFAHYRELVRPKDAERYWNIVPAMTAKNVVEFAQAAG